MIDTLQTCGATAGWIAVLGLAAVVLLALLTAACAYTIRQLMRYRLVPPSLQAREARADGGKGNGSVLAWGLCLLFFGAFLIALTQIG